MWGYALSTGVSLSLEADAESAVGGSGEDWLADGTSRAQATRCEGVAGMKVKRPAWLRADEGMEVISQEGTVAQM